MSETGSPPLTEVDAQQAEQFAAQQLLQEINESLAVPPQALAEPGTTLTAEALLAPTTAKQAQKVGAGALVGFMAPDGRIIPPVPTEQRVPRALTSEEKQTYDLPDDYSSPTEAIAPSPMQLAKETASSWGQLETERALEKAEQEANVDQLTGLPNYNRFMELTEEMFGHSKTAELGNANTETRNAFAFIDLDGLGKLNKLTNHDVADGVLKEVANKLTKKIIESGAGIAGRRSGDEFFVALVDQEPDTMDQIFKELEEEMRAITIESTTTEQNGQPEVWRGGITTGVAIAEGAGADAIGEAKTRANDMLVALKNDDMRGNHRIG